jgi:hypothetical protein
VPNTPLDKEVEVVAEEVIKNETGLDLPLDNSTVVIAPQKSA